MGKDKSAQERLEYGREIAKKESEIEERLRDSQKAQDLEETNASPRSLNLH